MNWEEFAPLIHESWHSRLKPFIESEECDKIYKFLKKESVRGRKIAPLSSDVWRCFMETPYDDLKVIIIGMSPYHTFKNGKPIADGLLMSCSLTEKLQPSLEQWYFAIAEEVYGDRKAKIDKCSDLKYLAKQGVLLLNTSLTCEANKPGSHNTLWEPFMKYLFERAILTTGMPVVFLGKEATKAKRYLAPFTWIIEVSHPASASYNNSDWDSEGLFLNVNKILKDNNNQSINWIKT